MNHIKDGLAVGVLVLIMLILHALSSKEGLRISIDGAVHTIKLLS